MATSRRRATRRIPALALALGVVAGGITVGMAPASPQAFASAADGAEAPGQATPAVTTDKGEYLTTGTVEYIGTNFVPGDPVRIIVEGPLSGAFDGEADADGSVGGTLQIVEVTDDGVTTGNTLDWTPGHYTLTLSQEVPVAEPECLAPVDSDAPTPTPPEMTPTPTATTGTDGDDDAQAPGETGGDDGTDSIPGTDGAHADAGDDADDGTTGALGPAPESETVKSACGPTVPLEATTTFSVVEPDPAAAQPVDGGDQLAPTGSDDHLGIAGIGLLALAAGATALACLRRRSRTQ
ncbi:hypothetical protein GCM10011490_24580 [Pseudoclavibacter endophyticus]|uniref:LPXTG cell wall anchor domain-containing protein n=1 Tax=Pseudoclavibacter endophyticus TaxID=1778590 RepID=A0A6H9WFT9_9MICO|nr:hypothetical protein [Pseudoclavibacter endophyticus]KAB1647794.1 hypothetical protein F8O04_12275 [Pseudoclavibacter endophyticus]GGA72878.1 hypothetical protein GCM10011490_24580 [Pseudoclavibacter endophyticus]